MASSSRSDGRLGGAALGPASAWVALAVALAPAAARAGRDYDPVSDDWNGLGRLVDLAHEEGLVVHVPRTLDWDHLDPGAGVLIVYPTTPVSRDGLVAHLRRGGRALLADDFGAGDQALGPLGVMRDEGAVPGGLRYRDRDELPVAMPVDEEHLLARGVRRLVANNPAAFVSDLPPVFVMGDPPRTLVAVGAVGPGRLVVLGDPSVLINNMLELRGNEQFARNLLRYVAGDGSRPLLLATGRFAQRAGGETVSGAAAAARQELNAALLRLGDALRPSPSGPAPLWAILLAAFGSVVTLAATLLRLGPRPRLYRGRWLLPRERQRAAGFVGTVEYLGGANATQVYPLLILKREFEARLLVGLGLTAPQRLDAVLESYGAKVRSKTEVRRLERLLLRLGGVASAAMASGSSLRISRRELERTMDLARGHLRRLGQDIEEPT